MTIIAFLSLAAWLYLVFARGGFWKAECSDDDRYPEVKTWPQVTVVIPARNEADMLAHTLPSLLNHDYPDIHIVLVDDRSEDGTAAVAARIAEESNAPGRLSVVQASPTPQGWKGKPWAMQCGLKQGAAMRTPKYMLFTDADIRYDKGMLKQLVARAETENRVLTSFMVLLHCKVPAERYLIPAFVFFFQMLYPFAWVRRGKCAAAAGGSMLARYDALQKAGGLEPIKSALIDDCALARLMRKQGRLWLGLTRHVVSLRDYPDVSDIRSMIVRTAYDQLNYSPYYLTGMILGMALVFLAPVWLAFFASSIPQICGIVSWVLMSVAFLPINRFYGCPRSYCVLLPIIAIIYMLFTLDSAWQYKQGRGGLWKGRVQAVSASV